MGFTTVLFALVTVQLILNTGAQKSKNVRDDYTYLSATEGFYKIHSWFDSWYTARVRCAEEGATLFFPENKKEAEEVIAFYNGKRVESDWIIHIGITDKLEEGIFETIDGRSIADVYNTWDVGQPSNSHGGEDCVTFRRSGLLNDDNCDEGHYFICKMVVRSDESRNHDQPITRYFRKDYTFLNPFKSFYKMHHESRTWIEAKKMCTLEGATLFYPENEYEAIEVINSSILKSYSWSDDIFMGISKLVAKWHFVTINGRPLADVYNKWAAGEPNDDEGKEHCVTLRKDLTLNDYRCYWDKPFICKRAYEDIQWDEECNMPKFMGYVYNSKLGRCYKFHIESKNWIEAFKVCRDEKSYLAIIDSQAEADYLAKLINDVVVDEVHLGYHKRFKDGWTTIKGDSLEEAGYSTWGYINPDGGDGEQCGSMFFDRSDQAMLNHLSCDKRTFFICEHETNSTNEIDNRLHRL